MIVVGAVGARLGSLSRRDAGRVGVLVRAFVRAFVRIFVCMFALMCVPVVRCVHVVVAMTGILRLRSTVCVPLSCA